MTTSGPARWLALLAGAVVLAWPTPYLEAIRSPNELVRVYLVRAIVDEGSIRIDGQVQRYGPLTDMAARDGHFYADKAPGASFMGVPVYAALRVFQPADRISNRSLVLWLRFLLIVAPTIAWMFVLSKLLESLEVPADLVSMAPLAYVLATPAFAYSLAFMGAQASAWMVGIALALAWKSRSGSDACRAGSGVLAAAAAVTEYPTAPMVVIVALLAVWGASRPWRGLAWFAAAAAPPLALGAVYHSVAFGGPMTTGYEFVTNPAFRDLYRAGVMGVSLPDPTAVWELTLGAKRGLLALAPWLVLAPFGVLAIRNRPHAGLVVALVVDVAIHLWVATGYQYWIGGWSVGPRHLVPAVPALVILGILGWQQLRDRVPAADLCFRGLLVASVAVMCAVCVTFPGFPEELTDPVFDLTLPMFADFQFSASLPYLLGVRSDIAMVPAILVMLVAMCWLAAGAPGNRREWRRQLWPLGGALWIALALFTVRTVWREPPTCEAVFRAAWFRQIVWEPTDVPRQFDSRLAGWEQARLAVQNGVVDSEKFLSLAAVNAHCGQFREALRDYVLAASTPVPQVKTEPRRQ